MESFIAEFRESWRVREARVRDTPLTHPWGLAAAPLPTPAGKVQLDAPDFRDEPKETAAGVAA